MIVQKVIIVRAYIQGHAKSLRRVDASNEAILHEVNALPLFNTT